MLGITENETIMLTVLSQILDISTDDCNRIYTGNDPVVTACNAYYKETFGVTCTEIHQHGKHFHPILSKPITSDMMTGLSGKDISNFEQLEFDM